MEFGMYILYTNKYSYVPAEQPQEQQTEQQRIKIRWIWGYELALYYCEFPSFVVSVLNAWWFL